MDPLSQLKDIKLPHDVSIWPLAYGWYVMLIILLVFSMILLFIYKQYRKKTFVKRMILTRLAVLKNEKQNSIQCKNIFEELSSLLKQAALYVYPRKEVAGLQGIAWLEFLDKTLPKQNCSFSQGPGQILLSAPYKMKVDDNIEDVITLIEIWVKKNL
jgi:hypothetical protein